MAAKRKRKRSRRVLVKRKRMFRGRRLAVFREGWGVVVFRSSLRNEDDKNNNHNNNDDKGLVGSSLGCSLGSTMMNTKRTYHTRGPLLRRAL